MRTEHDLHIDPLIGNATSDLGEPFAQLGPGLITGCADDDLSGIGAGFGYGPLWTALASFRHDDSRSTHVRPAWHGHRPRSSRHC
jgi:hypothetical protein